MVIDPIIGARLVLLVEILALAVVIWAVAIQGSSMLTRLFALQSFLLALGTSLIALVTGVHHLLYAATFTFVFKVILTPIVLRYIRRRIQPRIEPPDALSVPSSLIVASILTIVAYGATLRIAHPTNVFNVSGVLAVALSVMLIGFFIMVNRRATLNQVIGLLFMENGVFLAAIAMTYGMPLLVEFGVFFDVLVAILIMGVILFKINATQAGIQVKGEE